MTNYPICTDCPASANTERMTLEQFASTYCWPCLERNPVELDADDPAVTESHTCDDCGSLIDHPGRCEFCEDRREAMDLRAYARGMA